MTGLDNQTLADLLEVIDDRAAVKATIITSQLPIEHWHAWAGDATVADAMRDRLIQKNHRIVLTGESQRQASKVIKKEKKKTYRDRHFYNLRVQHMTQRNRSR
jgi:DNA replication protein DnaC